MVNPPWFFYACRQASWFLYGENPRQIIETIRYYKEDRGASHLEIPSENDLEVKNELWLSAVFPLSLDDQNLSLEFPNKVRFKVNANAFDHVRKTLRDFERLKRGELYKFVIDHRFVHFIPQSVIRPIAEYNLAQHTSQVDQWLAQREDILNNIPCIKRIKPNNNY